MKIAIPIICCMAVMIGSVSAQSQSVPEKLRSDYSPVLLRMEANTQVGADADPLESGKNTATAVAMSDDGLLITTLGAVDPLSFLGDKVSGDEYRLKVSNLKVVLPDATELPAQVVLRDKNTGFAVIKLTQKPKTPLQALPLAQDNPLDIGDDIYLVDRLGSDMQDLCVVSSQMVMAKLTNPITRAVITGGNVVGAIVCNSAGNVCGLVATYRPDAKRTYMVYTVVSNNELKALLQKARSVKADSADTSGAGQSTKQL